MDGGGHTVCHITKPASKTELKRELKVDVHSSYLSQPAVVYFFKLEYFRKRDCFLPILFREYKRQSFNILS